MSEARIKGRWMYWNMFGHGIDRSPFESTKYAYRGSVLFANGWPVGRFVPAPKDDFVVLYKPGGYLAKTEFKTKPNIIDCILVEDFGVFSKFEGDMLDVDALHERSKWLFFAEASDIIERANTVPESVLATANQYNRGSGQKLMRDMGMVLVLYDRYQLTFGLRWPLFPPTYMEQIASIIHARNSHYNSPREEAKRERKAAREEAKKALGLT